MLRWPWQFHPWPVVDVVFVRPARPFTLSQSTKKMRRPPDSSSSASSRFFLQFTRDATRTRWSTVKRTSVRGHARTRRLGDQVRKIPLRALPSVSCDWLTGRPPAQGGEREGARLARRPAPPQGKLDSTVFRRRMALYCTRALAIFSILNTTLKCDISIKFRLTWSVYTTIARYFLDTPDITRLLAGDVFLFSVT